MPSAGHMCEYPPLPRLGASQLLCGLYFSAPWCSQSRTCWIRRLPGVFDKTDSSLRPLTWWESGFIPCCTEDALLTQDIGKVLLQHSGSSLCRSIESHHGTAPLCGPVLHGAASLLPGPRHSLAHTQGLVHRHRVDWPLGSLGLACLAGRSSSLCLSLWCEFCPQSLFEFAPCPPSKHPCLHSSSWGLPAADILDARQACPSAS